MKKEKKTNVIKENTIREIKETIIKKFFKKNIELNKDLI